MTACWSVTSMSDRTMSLAGSRPAVMRSASTMRSRTISRPVAVVESARIRNMARSPVEEDGDDVRDERGNQRDRQRHMQIEPHLEQGADAKVACDLGKQGLLFAEQGLEPAHCLTRGRPVVRLQQR